MRIPFHLVIASLLAIRSAIPAARAAATAADTNGTPTSTTQSPAPPRLRVAVDPRVELMSLLFRLAGNPEYNQAKVQSYSADVDEQFGSQRDHAVIQLARQLRQTREVSFDACMSLAVHVDNTRDLQPVVPLDPWPDGLDNRWTTTSVSNFLSGARQFVKDTGFDDFLRKHQPLYDTTVSRMEALLKKEGHLEWFPSYFGEQAQADFIIAPALLNGGSCYGSHCWRTADREELYCMLGVWQTDWSGLPEFTPDMLTTIVHEFCHSYANAIVDRHQKELAAAGEKLFRHVADQMRSQAYGNAETLLRESLVRACTVRYLNRYAGADAARRDIDRNIKRGFAWTGELSGLLAEYEAQRERYPTLESFAPRLVAFFNTYADKFDKAQDALAARRPKVLTTVPANGARDVDPSLSEIQVTFDRPMQDGSWSMVGGGPHYPETTGRPHYDATLTTWSVPVKLKPGWSYEFRLNGGQYDSFRSKEGVPLESVLVRFTTK